MNNDNFHGLMCGESGTLCACVCVCVCVRARARARVCFRVFCSENISRMVLITKRSIERNDINGLWYKRYTAFLKKLL